MKTLSKNELSQTQGGGFFLAVFIASLIIGILLGGNSN